MLRVFIFIINIFIGLVESRYSINDGALVDVKSLIVAVSVSIVCFLLVSCQCHGSQGESPRRESKLRTK